MPYFTELMIDFLKKNWRSIGNKVLILDQKTVVYCFWIMIFCYTEVTEL